MGKVNSRIFLLVLMGMLTALAMECQRNNAGTASALLGAVGFAFGGIVSPLVGLGNILTSTGIIISNLSGRNVGYLRLNSVCPPYLLRIRSVSGPYMLRLYRHGDDTK